MFETSHCPEDMHTNKMHDMELHLWPIPEAVVPLYTRTRALEHCLEGLLLVELHGQAFQTPHGSNLEERSLVVGRRIAWFQPRYLEKNFANAVVVTLVDKVDQAVKFQWFQHFQGIFSKVDMSSFPFNFVVSLKEAWHHLHQALGT